MVYFRNYGEKTFRPAPQFKSQAALDAFRRSCTVSPFEESSFQEKDYLETLPIGDDKAPWMLFYDGFESSLGAWSVGNEGDPDIDWDPVLCRKHNYTYSAYALGGGPDTPGDCSNEVSGTKNYMRHTGVNVTSSPSLYLEYYRWVDVVFRHNFMTLDATSGDIYWMADFFTGNSNGWQARKIYMEGFDGDTYTNLNFQFTYECHSDSTKEGVYIDDVLVTRDRVGLELYYLNMFPYMPDTGNPGQAGTFRSNLYIHNPHGATVNIRCFTRHSGANYEYTFTVAARRASSLANILRCIVNESHTPPSTPLGWGSYLMVYSDLPIGVVGGYVDNQTDDPAVTGPMDTGMINAFAPLAIKSGPWNTELAVANPNYQECSLYMELVNPFTGGYIGDATVDIGMLDSFHTNDVVGYLGGSAGQFGVLHLYSLSNGSAGYAVPFYGMTRQYTTSHTGASTPCLTFSP